MDGVSALWVLLSLLRTFYENSKLRRSIQETIKITKVRLIILFANFCVTLNMLEVLGRLNSLFRDGESWKKLWGYYYELFYE